MLIKMFVSVWICAFGLTVVLANDAPVIGVLSQEVYAVEGLFPNEEYHSFIAASYVKFLESAGARVIPIWIGRDKNYYESVIKNTNGVFLPGGATWFNESNGFGDAGQYLYDAALEVNKNGDYYPVWGTCLGMELLMQVSINGEEIRAHCSASKVDMPLVFTEDFRSSKLFSNAPAKVINILKTENVTANNHRYCITQQNFTLHNLSDKWRILSTNKDIHGLEFISSYESPTYPFYAIQFHPEKNLFEFRTSTYVDHSTHAVIVSQYFADFFVDEARKNSHSFDNSAEEQKRLIYNYSPKYSGALGSSYEQLYMFTQEDNLKN